MCYFLSEMYFETSGTDVSIQHLKLKSCAHIMFRALSTWPKCFNLDKNTIGHVSI